MVPKPKKNFKYGPNLVRLNLKVWVGSYFLPLLMIMPNQAFPKTSFFFE
jgi:hypothetical protein